LTKLERSKGSKHVVMTFSGFTEEKDLSYDNWGQVAEELRAQSNTDVYDLKWKSNSKLSIITEIVLKASLLVGVKYFPNPLTTMITIE
jgi:hypothetical protein